MSSALDFNDLSSDPPIIISGGGGGTSRVANNSLAIDYEEDVTPPRPRRRIRARPNADPYINGVTVEIEGTDGTTTRTATLAFPFLMQSYKVTVKFSTEKETTPPDKKRTAKGDSKAKPKPTKKRK